MAAKQTAHSETVGSSDLIPKFQLTGRKFWLVALLIALLGLALLLKSLAAENIQIISSIEGEQLTANPGRVVSKTGASNGAAMGMLWNGTATWNVTPSSNVNRVVVRAEGTICNGNPNMVVKVNGVTASTVSVGTAWNDYVTSVSLPANKAVQVQVVFPNDFSTSECDRNLYIDKVSLGYATQLDKIGTMEAEQMQDSALYHQTVNYAGASGSQAVELLSNGTLTGIAEPTADVSQIQISALANNCNGSPSFTLSVNGQNVLTATVSSTTWQTFTANVSMPKGVGAKIVLSYNNDYYNPPTCDRNLWIDKLDMWGKIITAPVPVPQSNIKLSLDANKQNQVDVSNVPAGTNHLHFAVLTSMTANISDSTQIHYIDLPANTTTYVPPAGFPVVDVTAMGDAANQQQIGNWAGRVQTSPVSTTPTPTPTPIPTPIPTPTPTPSSGMIVGVNGANYGAGGATDVKGAVNWARMDDELSTTAIAQYEANGILLDVDFSGPYVNGVSAINTSSWVSSKLSWYTTNCTPAKCPIIEVLNEPYGNWFWGSNADSQTNADAYARLLQATWNAFHSKYGSSAPKVIAAYDSLSWDNFWGKEWSTSKAVSSPLQYVDGVVVHPYGGVDNRAASALGSRDYVTNAHNETGKPVYVTEVGWPTAVGQSPTGDSLQWSETDQANNLFNFIGWARSTGYVNAVFYFNYHDFGSNNWYGIVRSDGSHKPSYNALKCSAQNKPIGC